VQGTRFTEHVTHSYTGYTVTGVSGNGNGNPYCTAIFIEVTT